MCRVDKKFQELVPNLTLYRGLGGQEYMLTKLELHKPKEKLCNCLIFIPWNLELQHRRISRVFILKTLLTFSQ